jgi:hypothetical protein
VGLNPKCSVLEALDDTEMGDKTGVEAKEEDDTIIGDEQANKGEESLSDNSDGLGMKTVLCVIKRVH